MKKRPKHGWRKEDWPDKGTVNSHGYCTLCRTYWCPHAKPELYRD